MPGTKFLPHVEQLEEAAKQLPDAELWPEDHYNAMLQGKSHTYEISFRRIRYLSRTKGWTYRWAYEGLVRVT